MNREQRRAAGNYETLEDVRGLVQTSVDIDKKEEEIAMKYVQSKMDACLEQGVPFDESMLSTDEFSKILENKCQ
jgi:hypothetical protein